MAAPRSPLTAEQARRNLELFQGHHHAVAHAKLKIKTNVPSTGIGEVICRAIASSLPEITSPSDLETFSNPKLHLDVVSTFLATAMTSADYFPNQSYGGKVEDAATEFQGFAHLIDSLGIFGIYMPLKATDSEEFPYGPKEDYTTLLEKVQSFVAMSGIDDATIITRDLIVKAASLTSTADSEHTAFVAYHFQGAVSNPLLYIFYGTATMRRCTDLGISVATANQKIEVSFSKYQLDSSLVTNNAKSLATVTVVSAEKMTETINKRFLLPRYALLPAFQISGGYVYNT